jgi:hypothetical protein
MCGDDFQFTERDQDFYREHDYTPPKRCRPCREKRKAETEQQSNEGYR